MKILIACEFSGVVRRQFRRWGFDAYSCDLLPAEDKETKYHIQSDVNMVLYQGWTLMIAHPPCTYLCNSGVRWLQTEPGRLEKMRSAARFFRKLLDAPIPYIAVENPVMHKHALEIVKQTQSCSVQPWQFGDGEVKRTCFWLKNLPPLKPVSDLVQTRHARVHLEPPSDTRWMERSRTPQGMAEAFVQQWGNYIREQTKPN